MLHGPPLLELGGSSKNELQANPVSMRRRGPLDPADLQKCGNPDRQLRKWDLTSKDLRQLNCPIAEKAQAAGAEILKLPPEELLAFFL